MSKEDEKSVQRYDLRVAKKSDVDAEKVRKAMESLGARHWTFQLEKGGHWFARVSLIKRSTAKKLQSRFDSEPELQCLSGAEVTVTGKGIHSNRRFDHRLPSNNRLDGPWFDVEFQNYTRRPSVETKTTTVVVADDAEDDTSAAEPETKREGEPLTPSSSSTVAAAGSSSSVSYRNPSADPEKLWSWQKSVIEKCEEEDLEGTDNKIDVLLDRSGQMGKTWLLRHLGGREERTIIEMPDSEVKDALKWAGSAVNCRAKAFICNLSIPLCDSSRAEVDASCPWTFLPDAVKHMQMSTLWGKFVKLRKGIVCRASQQGGGGQLFHSFPMTPPPKVWVFLSAVPELHPLLERARLWTICPDKKILRSIVHPYPPARSPVAVTYQQPRDDGEEKSSEEEEAAAARTETKRRRLAWNRPQKPSAAAARRASAARKTYRSFDTYYTTQEEKDKVQRMPVKELDEYLLSEFGPAGQRAFYERCGLYAMYRAMGKPEFYRYVEDLQRKNAEAARLKWEREQKAQEEEEKRRAATLQADPPSSSLSPAECATAGVTTPLSSFSSSSSSDSAPLGSTSSPEIQAVEKEVQVSPSIPDIHKDAKDDMGEPETKRGAGGSVTSLIAIDGLSEHGELSCSIDSAQPTIANSVAEGEDGSSQSGTDRSESTSTSGRKRKQMSDAAAAHDDKDHNNELTSSSDPKNTDDAERLRPLPKTSRLTCT